GQLRPLAARAQDIHHPVDDRSHFHGALVAAPLGWRNRRPNQRPFLVRQVARVAQFAAVIATAVLVRPHLAAPCESGSHKGITTDSEDSTCFRMDTQGTSSGAQSGLSSSSRNSGRNEGVSEQARELIKPDEVRTGMRADEVDPVLRTSLVGTQGGSVAVLTIMRIKPPAVAVAAVG